MEPAYGTLLGTILLTAALASTPGAQAQSSAPPAEGLFLDELPRVLSVTRLAQPVTTAPAAVTIIDRELIEVSGLRELSSLFRLVPGMQVGNFSGSQHTVTVHGMADQFARRMQVLVDGRSVYSPLTGGVDWTDLPLALEDVERIEVIRGPNAATHGTNAFLGVISITTRHAADAAGTDFKYTTGEDGVADGVVRHGGRLGPLDYRLTLAHYRDDGFGGRHDRSTARLANLRLDYQASQFDELTVQAGYNDGPREEGFADDPVFIPNRVENHTRFAQGNWEHRWNEANATRVQAYTTEYSTRERIAQVVDLAPGVSPEDLLRGFLTHGQLDADLLALAPREHRSETRRLDLEVNHTTGGGERWRLVVGAGVRRDSVRSTLYLGDAGARENTQRRLFANLEWRPHPRVTVNAGALGEEDDITGEAWSPRVAVNIQTRPGHALRAAMSRAYRAPVIAEDQAGMFLDTDPLVARLTPTVERTNALRALVPLPPVVLPDITIPMFVATADLDRETITSREIGYVAEFPRAALTVDARYFHEQMEDLVDTVERLDSGIDYFTFANSDQATIHGWELHLDWRPTPEVRLWVAYSRVDGDSNDPRTAASSPEHTASVLGLYRFPDDLTASAAYYWIGEHSWLGDGNKAQPIIRRLDLRLAKGWRMGPSRVEIAATVQNLGDPYLDFLGEADRPSKYNAFDTRALVTVAVRF